MKTDGTELSGLDLYGWIKEVGVWVFVFVRYALSCVWLTVTLLAEVSVTAKVLHHSHRVMKSERERRQVGEHSLLFVSPSTVNPTRELGTKYKVREAEGGECFLFSLLQIEFTALTSRAQRYWFECLSPGEVPWRQQFSPIFLRFRHLSSHQLLCWFSVTVFLFF